MVVRVFSRTRTRRCGFNQTLAQSRSLRHPLFLRPPLWGTTWGFQWFGVANLRGFRDMDDDARN